MKASKPIVNSYSLGELSVTQFLRDYWQKRPVLLKAAFQADPMPLSADELAGLSLEDDIDTRIVMHDPKKDKWKIEHGPFAEDRFQKLKKTGWTLLVQGVDHWVPAVAALRQGFGFIPQWRFDDIMVSYAVRGGGVGPHLDQYDVFLMQGMGRRRWLVGDKDQPVTVNPAVTALRQVLPYPASMDVTVEPGDILYIPPNTPHWGTALDECMTYSVGFRAPASTDILTLYTDHLITENIDGDRYADPDWHPTHDEGLIPASALQRVHHLLTQALANPLQAELCFGSLVTQTRYPLAREGRKILTEAKCTELFNSGREFKRVDDARCAWFVATDRSIRLFANGEEIVGTFSSEFASFLCNSPSISKINADVYRQQLAFFQVLTTLINRGAFYF